MDLSSLSKEELIKKIEEIKIENSNLKSKIELLDKFNSAYDKVAKLTQYELVDAQKIINAQEVVSELSREELLFLLATQKAYERLIELFNAELKSAYDTIRAHENVEGFSREEKIFLDATIKAYENMAHLSKRELDEAYRTITAHEMVEELARQEGMILLKKLRN